MGKRPELSESIVISQDWLNRRKDALTGSLQTYKGTNVFDLRKYAMTREGKLVPTAKGITIAVTRLRDLEKAVGRAIKRAVELGLIDEVE
jgi:hypothetical protein